MGRKSVKENKNIYHLSREALGYSRAVAAEKMKYISADRIEKIENEKSLPHPEEVLAMADCYHNPSLCNHFCSHECPIGQEYVPEVQAKELSQITLEMLSTLNILSNEKDRLIEITLLWFKHMLCYIVAYLVNIIRLLSHQIIDRSIMTCFEFAHDSVKGFRFCLCHCYILYVLIS